jgi:hypothetical protein
MEDTERLSKTSRALSEFNLLALRYSGYTGGEIRKFGDLSQLSEERMQGLIHAKALDALAKWARGEVAAGRLKIRRL